MALEVDQLAVEDTCHLVDAIGKEKPAVKDRNPRLFLGQVVSIDLNSAAHDLSPEFGTRRVQTLGVVFKRCVAVFGQKQGTV